MAAITTAVAGGLALAGAGTSIASGIRKNKEGKSLQQKGQRAIDNFEWQDLDAAIPIMTEGSEMMMEENARTAATSVDALAASGSRGVLGGVGKVQAVTNTENQKARAYLDDQIIRKAYTKLGMTENRQANELDGYGQMMNVGMGMKYQGNADIYNGLMSAGENIMSMGMTNQGITKKETSAMTPVGATSNFDVTDWEYDGSASLYPTNYGNV